MIGLSSSVTINLYPTLWLRLPNTCVAQIDLVFCIPFIVFQLALVHRVLRGQSQVNLLSTLIVPLKQRQGAFTTAPVSPAVGYWRDQCSSQHVYHTAL